MFIQGHLWHSQYFAVAKIMPISQPMVTDKIMVFLPLGAAIALPCSVIGTLWAPSLTTRGAARGQQSKYLFLEI